MGTRFSRSAVGPVFKYVQIWSGVRGAQEVADKDFRSDPDQLNQLNQLRRLSVGRPNVVLLSYGGLRLQYVGVFGRETRGDSQY